MAKIEETDYLDHSNDSLMADLFLSIGFSVSDDRAYETLAEQAETQGKLSQTHRGNATLHGWCWRVGGGLEVWSVIYETEVEMYHVDCRPAYRGRYVYHIQPWEMIEFDEDGEALVRGCLSTGAEIIFELQNLTEIASSAFREPHMHVSLAGLAYRAEVLASKKSKTEELRFELAEKLPELAQEACESDYLICGRVLAWREIANADTGERLVWLYLDAGKIKLEILVNRRALRGRLRVGALVRANVWLQGHVLAAQDIFARYEGVDWDYPTSDFWAGLRRDN
jgi:hypothetical protein